MKHSEENIEPFFSNLGFGKNFLNTHTQGKTLARRKIVNLTSTKLKYFYIEVFKEK